MSPLPAPVQVPPPVPEQVHVAPAIAAGTGSLTVAPLTSDGPAFVTVIR
jgi:hypothetical protein